MAQFKLPPMETSEKLLTVLCGDVSKKNFALSQNVYDSLRSQITRIDHTAANTNFLLDYSFGSRENFLSTCEILRFTFSTRPAKHLLYISTLSVFGSRITSGDTLSEDDLNSDMGCVLHGDGYSQSKWLSEQILFSTARKHSELFHSSSSSSCAVVRLGLIGFSSASGIGNGRDWFSMLFRSMVQSLSRPHSPLTRFNLLPVNLAAEVLNLIGNSLEEERTRSSAPLTPSEIQVFHLSHTSEISFDEIVQKWFESVPWKVISPSFSEWLRDVTQRPDDILLPLVSFLQSGLPPPGRIRQSRSMELCREKWAQIVSPISVTSGKEYAKFLMNIQQYPK